MTVSVSLRSPWPPSDPSSTEVEESEQSLVGGQHGGRKAQVLTSLQLTPAQDAGGERVERGGASAGAMEYRFSEEALQL